MLNENFNSEKTIKIWAKSFNICSLVFAALSILGAIIALAALYRGELISVIIFVSGMLLAIVALFASHVVWGFAEIVGNSKKIVEGNKSQRDTEELHLPEL